MLKKMWDLWLRVHYRLLGRRGRPIPPEGYGWVKYDENGEPVQAYNCTEQDLYTDKEG